MDKIPIPNDWNEETDGYAFVWFCIPNSPLWRGVVRGKIYELTRGRIWDEVTGNIKDTQTIAWEIYEGICMACGDELLAKLERIAVAIESIDEKAVQRVTWEEMMTDLANTLGVTNAIYKIAKWIGDLFPSFKVKADATPIVQMIFDHYFWKSLILANLKAINLSLAAIAAAQVAEKPLSLLKTLFAGFDSLLNLNNRIYDFILGDWNWYDDVLKPLWDSFISDGEGGTGGDDPDADPANRNITRVYNDVFVEGDAINVTCSPDVTVNCGSGGGCCGGGGALGSPITGSLTDSDPAEEPGDPEIDPPPTGFDSWEEYNLHKCRAANFIAQGTEQLFRLLGGANAYVSAGAIAGAGKAITELLFGAASLAMSAGALGGAAGVSLLAGGVISTLPGWVVGAIVAAILLVIVAEVSILLLFINAADEYHTNIEQTVCDLYNAQTVEDAKSKLSTAWGDAIASFAIDPPYNAWEAAIRSMMSTVIGYVITNTLVNMLFEPSDLINKYTDAPVDCDTCSTPGVFDFTVDEQGWLIDEANSTNGEYVTGQYFKGSYPDIGDAVLHIYNPELSSVVTVKAWVTGSTGGIGRLSLLTADELEGPWTEVSYFDQFLTPGFTMKEFTNLNIINKYIRLGLLVFWNGPSVYVNRIEFEGVEE